MLLVLAEQEREALNSSKLEAGKDTASWKWLEQPAESHLDGEKVPVKEWARDFPFGWEWDLLPLVSDVRV